MNSKLVFKPPVPNDLIKGFKSFSTIFAAFGFKAKPNVNSVLLKFHSTITSFILICALTLLSMKSYFGENSIECTTGRTDIPPSQIVHYCWMEGSFSVYHRTRHASDTDNGYPGVSTPKESDKLVYHRYYQWVYFVLILQSIMFYVPKYVWKKHEAQKLVNLITDLRDNHIESLCLYDKYRLLQEVADAMYIGNTFFNYFILSDILCFLNICAQIWLTNLFLGGDFWTLGFEWYFYSVTDTKKHMDPLLRIFPRQVKCSFHKFGASGTRETIDSLCFLPQNIVNEKIYLFLWVWFMFLLTFTSLVLASRSLYVMPFYRYLVIQQNAHCFTKIAFRRVCDRLGNWFVLYNIAKNIRPSYFSYLLEELLDAHFDKRGKRTASSHFITQLSTRAKIELKTPVKPSAPAIGWNVGDANNDNCTEIDWNTDVGWNTTNNEESNQKDYAWMAPEPVWGCDS